MLFDSIAWQFAARAIISLRYLRHKYNWGNEESCHLYWDIFEFVVTGFSLVGCANRLLLCIIQLILVFFFIFSTD